MTSTVTQVASEYSGNQMSDGEKAALYLMCKVMNAVPGLLIVDEPETHFHSLLAVQLWDVLEAKRKDLRFAYVTHNVTFALSRRSPAVLLSSPVTGLTHVELPETVPTEVVPALLGSASFSFYAKRAVFCEGEPSSPDAGLYRAWFGDSSTVVLSVGSCDRVIRSVSAMSDASFVSGLSVIGLIDRDYHPDAYLGSLGEVHPLGVNEVESLYCLPGVVAAVCGYLKKPFDRPSYERELRESINDGERQKIVLERWKRQVEPQLKSLVSSVKINHGSIDGILGQIPTLFDYKKWGFSPEGMLKEEKSSIEGVFPNGAFDEFMKIAPGKPLLGIALSKARMNSFDYRNLINQLIASNDPSTEAVKAEICEAMAPHLPPRSGK